MTTSVVWAAERHFEPVETSPGQARDFVTSQLLRHDLAYLADDVRLVVSELVTNAVIHAATPTHVRLEELSFCVKLTVSDDSVDMPVRRLSSRLTSHDEGGRGLWAVDACSADWGTDLAGSEGKCIWALFAVRPTSSWVTSTAHGESHRLQGSPQEPQVAPST